MSCRLMPGTELRESELAERFEVSKSPVRDALQKLELEGLIEIEPRQSHRVTSISLKDMEDIVDFRLVIETDCLRKAVKFATNDALSALNRFRTVGPNSNLDDFLAYNREFHYSLAALSGNKRAAEAMLRLMDHYDRICALRLTVSNNQWDLQDHNKIIDALQARDGTKSVQVARNHMMKSRKLILSSRKKEPIIP